MGRRNREPDMQATGKQIVEPYDPVAAKAVIDVGSGLLEQGVSPYEGPRYSPLDPGALNQIERYANTQNPNLPAAQGALGDILGGGGTTAASQYLTPFAEGQYVSSPLEQNPHLAALYERGAEDLRNRLMSEAAFSGRMGGNRWLPQAIGRSTGDLYASIYGPAWEAQQARKLQERGHQLSAANLLGSFDLQGQGQQLQAAGLLPAMDQMGLNRARAGLEAGMLRQQDEQNRLLALQAAHQERQWLPYQSAQAASQIMQPYVLPGTTTDYEVPPSRLAGLLPGAATGFQIGSRLGFPLLGAGIGGLLGFGTG